jgi:hypothetical protein
MVAVFQAGGLSSGAVWPGLGGFALEGGFFACEVGLGFEAGGGGSGEGFGAGFCVGGFFAEGLKFLLFGAQAGGAGGLGR